MDSFINLIIAALGITLVDIDNAVYSSSRLGLLKKNQRMVLAMMLGLEFVGRIILLVVFAILTSEQEPLFTIFGIEITIETLSLFAAGFYLLISNGRAMLERLQDRQGEEVNYVEQDLNLGSFLVKSSLVLTLMSVDTVLVISSQYTAIGIIFFLLLFSAVVRFLFVDRLVYFIDNYPMVELFVTALLILIGVELIIQGLGFDAEWFFNIVIVLLIVAVVAFERRSSKKTIDSEQ